MKPTTIAILLGTSATLIGASPTIEARQQSECKKSSPGTDTNNDILGTITTWGTPPNDVGGSGLFSYTRPASGSSVGSLYISNTNDAGRIIELRTGTTRNTFSVDAGHTCQVQLRVPSIDHYRVWTY